MAVEITRLDRSAQDLRRLARLSSNTYQAHRLLALAAILDGARRCDAAKMAGMDRQTLRDWISPLQCGRAGGIAGRPRSGRRPLLQLDQLAKLEQIVETPPDPVKDRVVRSRSRASSGTASGSGSPNAPLGAFSTNGAFAGFRRARSIQRLSRCLSKLSGKLFQDLEREPP